MNKKSFYISAVILLISILCAFSCSDDETRPTLSVEPSALSFTLEAAESYDVAVTTNQQSWDAVSNQTWCTIVKGANQFTVTATANTTVERTATITVSAGNAVDVLIEVTQAGIIPQLSVSPNTPISFTKDGGTGETKTITVTTNLPSWDAVSNQTWCTIVKGANQFSVTATANATTYERAATITVSAGGANVTIEVTQAGVKPQLSISPNTPIIFTKNGGAKTITVTTNLPSWNATSDQSWCTITKETNQFTVTATAYTGSSNRSAIITVTAGNASDVTLSVSQVSEPNIAFFARNPTTEALYKNGFFFGSRVNFDLVVYDAAGMTSITIEEVAKGSPNGNAKEIRQTRVIPISGPGTYSLSQEMWNGNAAYANIYSQFTYTVSAYGKSYTSFYSGSYSSYNGAWSHYFGLN